MVKFILYFTCNNFVVYKYFCIRLRTYLLGALFTKNICETTNGACLLNYCLDALIDHSNNRIKNKNIF